jgi:hypothetical protein
MLGAPSSTSPLIAHERRRVGHGGVGDAVDPAGEAGDRHVRLDQPAHRLPDHPADDRHGGLQVVARLLSLQARHHCGTLGDVRDHQTARLGRASRDLPEPAR